MKRLFKFMVVLALGAFLLSGNVQAWDNLEHVTVAPNGKGDAAIIPMYVAAPGWETKIEVINTSYTHSTVAKVVVRSIVFSQEVLDFFIYLSPMDVWVGKLLYDNGAARLYSEDGSCLAGTRATGPKSTWASDSDPMDVILVSNCDNVQLGYVEIIQTWNGALGGPPVLKSVVKKAFDDAPDDLSDNGTLNSLAVHYEVNVPAYDWNLSERAVVLRDYDVTQKLSLAVESFLGSSSGSLSRNSACEVDAVLQKNYIAMPYYAYNHPFSAVHLFTFPTKYSRLDDDCFWRTPFVRSPFFAQNYAKGVTGYCVEYGHRTWDLEENTPTPGTSYSPIPESEKDYFCSELNLVTLETLGYDEGWVEYWFTSATSCTAENGLGSITFSGAPVIPTVFLIEGYGASLMSGAWDDTPVYYNGVRERFYHYGPFPK